MKILLKPVRDQVVVVFGASAGIGRATALELARRGARVVAVARGRDGLDSLLNEIAEAGGEAMAVVADAAVAEQVEAAAETAVEAYGRIDTWVHVAAVMLFAAFEDTTLEEFRRLIDVNLLGAVRGARAALPRLRCQGRGALILLSSVEGKVALPRQSAYAAGKAGLLAFADALRMELTHEGTPISVTTVLPATINTPLYDTARTKLGVKPQGVPPFYAPAVVARAIAHATEHPTREIIVGGAGKGLVLLHKLSPRLTDAVLERIAFKGEETDVAKAPDAPDNLYGPLPAHDSVSGTLEGRTFPRSLYTCLALNRGVRWALGAAGIVLVAAFVIAIWR